MPEIKGFTKVAQYIGTIRSVDVRGYEPVQRNCKINPFTGVTFNAIINGLDFSIGIDYFVFQEQGSSWFYKIDQFSNFTPFELSIFNRTGLLEFVLKEFKHISGYVGRGPGCDSEYYDYNIERAINIFAHQYFLDNPVDTTIHKYPTGTMTGGVSSTFTVSPYDEDPSDKTKSILKTDSFVINAQDLTPFAVINRSPDTDTILNAPNTEISFILSDESTGILLGELDINIDGDQVVTDGVITAVDGSASLEILSPPSNNLKYTYNKFTPFIGGQQVDVHIQGKDLSTPTGNITNLTYSFRVWDTNDLLGYIIIDPDLDAPYVTNTSPISGTLFGDPCGDISFDVVDDITGVDLDTIYVEFDGTVLISSGEILVDASLVSITSLEDGYHFVYTPTSCLQWDTDYGVTISGSDNYGPAPNSFIDTYSFHTIDNSSIIIENFFIEEIYESIGVNNETYITVDVKDYTNGIDINKTKLYYNGDSVPFTYTTISGGYTLSYQPDDLFVQSPDIEILIHAVNQIDLGFEVFAEKEYALSPGYRVTVPPGEYGYGEYIYPIVTADNVGRNPEEDTEVFKFRIHDEHYADLKGHIISSLDEKTLYGFIQPVSPLYYYNKVMTVRVEASDLEGNEMEPFEFNFRIQRKPE